MNHRVHFWEWLSYVSNQFYFRWALGCLASILRRLQAMETSVTLKHWEMNTLILPYSPLVLTHNTNAAFPPLHMLTLHLLFAFFIMHLFFFSVTRRQAWSLLSTFQKEGNKRLCTHCTFLFKLMV